MRSVAEKERDRGIIACALKRISENPAIYSVKVQRPTGKKGYGKDAIDKVVDLKENVPGISNRQISSLISISENSVRKMSGAGLIDTFPDRWTSDDNESSAAAELRALQDNHGSREYEDHEGAATEYDPVPVLFTAPRYPDIHRRADQSHTIKRPITLATEPYRWVA